MVIITILGENWSHASAGVEVKFITIITEKNTVFLNIEKHVHYFYFLNCYIRVHDQNVILVSYCRVQRHWRLLAIGVRECHIPGRPGKPIDGVETTVCSAPYLRQKSASIIVWGG